jgi:hypothetical protein
MAGSDFQVNVPSGFSNLDRESLSEGERAMAKGMAGSEEAMLRNKAAFLAEEDRRRERGKDLGEQVEKVLGEVGAGHRLISVTWNSSTLSWRLEIETPQGTQNVVLSWDLVDDALDARTRSELRRLRNMVLFGLGLRDLIFEKHE